MQSQIPAMVAMAGGVPSGLFSAGDSVDGEVDISDLLRVIDAWG